MKIFNYLARASFAVALVLLVVGIASTKAEATNLDYFQNDTPAFASDNFSWTGFYLGGNVGYSMGDVSVNGTKQTYKLVDDEFTPHKIFGTGIDGLSTRGWQYGIRGGYDWQIGSSPFVIGAFVGYNWGENEFKFSTGKTDLIHDNGRDFAFGLKGTLEPTWHAGIRVGYTPSNRSLLYVGYAYGQAKFDLNGGHSNGTHICEIEGMKCSDTLDGHTFLAGAELMVTDHISVGLEYNYTQYDSVPVFGKSWEKTYHADAGFKAVEAEPDVHAVMVRVNWRIKGVFQ